MFQECAAGRSHDLGKQAHAQMITSGFVPTIFVSNCLIHMYIKCSNPNYARGVFDRMPHRDVVSWNAMISCYANIGLMDMAQSIFDEIPGKDVISWNSLISGYQQSGRFQESAEIFLKMRQADMRPDHTTLAVGLKSCSALEDYYYGSQIHGLAVNMGLDVDVVTGSALVDMYAKCRRLNDSHQLFTEMPERNWVSWSALIAGYVQNDCLTHGLNLFQEMQGAGVPVSQSIYASVFRSCAGLSALDLGCQIHAHALKSDFGSDVIVGTAVLDMYAKSDSIEDARRVFCLLPKRSLQSWNAMIVGYARNNQGLESLSSFLLMWRSSFDVDEISFSGVFSACAGIEAYLEGLQIHALAIKAGFESNTCVGNAVLDMYGKCGDSVGAQKAFDNMDWRDAVSWNGIIAACEQNGCNEETLFCFGQMLSSGFEPDEFSYGSVLKACAGLQSLGCGMEIHSQVVKSGLGLDSFVGSALVHMYCKCGVIEDAEKLHDRLEDQTLVSWNAIISGFSMQKQSEEAQKFFRQLLDMGLRPDNFTYATVLDSCANLATIELGKQIHAQIIKQELLKDVYISSTLVDLYSKCGDMQDSLLMFEKMPEKDFVSWNAVIMGYAQHGLGLEALRMFERMQQEDVKPNHATFIAVLRACGHMGLFDEGSHYFHSMRTDYRLDPQLEHYSCMVDILGRSGKVNDALQLIYSMPFEPDAVIWRSLLGVCKIHGNIKVAELAAHSILQLDPQDSAAYVLLANVYAEAGRWSEVSEMRRLMKKNGLKKEPGCSWIEVKNEVHAFLMGDKAHPRCEEIYERLDELIRKMKRAGYVPDIDHVLNDEEDSEDVGKCLGICTNG
ncbi:hypothetical protein ACLOJK_035243 [Asimina triloba]